MLVKHNFYQNSQCLGSYLHRFNIVEEYTDGVLEVCEICKTKKFFKILDGKVDNQYYMSYHIRQALPPFHELYEHEFNYEPFNLISPYV